MIATGKETAGGWPAVGRGDHTEDLLPGPGTGLQAPMPTAALQEAFIILDEDTVLRQVTGLAPNHPG